ncbi:putative toxin-antitoxin system toxin component, PIN family [Paenibacillaceae bacterium WGS1546]|uniref:putative toxin-antitoxin system toxin component, PIN family n=1 Tax=Cohnella sp. WGS1546 TaxID=3366810 RepID=UPI00372D19A4
MTKPKVVIDTNVFIHALFYNKPECIKIMDLIEADAVELYFARDMIGELMYILKNFAIPNLSQSEGIELLEKFAGLFYISRSVNILKVNPPTLPKDQDDIMFLKCAYKANVDYLITNDGTSGLFSITGYSFNIVTAADFVKAMVPQAEVQETKTEEEAG